MIVLVLVLCFFIFGRAIRGGFLFDDPAIEEIASQPYRIDFWRAVPFRSSDPRMLTHMSYRWTFLAFGLYLPAWKAFQIALHAATAAVAYLTIAALWNSDAATLAAMVFLVHPLQASAVCYLSARSNMLSAFFGWASYLLFVVGQPVFSIVSVYLCVKSKQDGWLYLCGFPILFFLL